jgi:hypothetical protein
MKRELFESWDFESAGHASDFLSFHRYQYYSLGMARMPDAIFDECERAVKKRFPWLHVLNCIGGERETDYPLYVVQGRRPNAKERKARDAELRAQRLTYLLDC